MGESPLPAASAHFPVPPRSKFPPAAWPLAALLAWVLPGLGHYVIGERTRGLIVGVTLLSLFFGGMLVGGIDVVDFRRDTIWFVGQALFGPIALGANGLHVVLDPPPKLDKIDLEQRYPGPHPPPYDEPRYYTSIGRVNELGTLYCTLAGVLNLLAILDVVGRLTHIPADDELPTNGGAGESLMTGGRR